RRRGRGVTLTTRLLTFSLVTLGGVLAGFSTALWFLARGDLRREADTRLEAAVNTLVAACEVGPQGVEWEPHERALALPAGGAVVWAVLDPDGRPVDQSGAGAADRLAGAADRWRVRRARLDTPPATGPVPSVPAGEVRYPFLDVVVGADGAAEAAELRRLAAELAGLSAVVWLVALFAGRAVCRWALRPLTAMATAARAMPADPTGRLAVARPADELADLGRAFNDLLDRLGAAHERQRRFAGEASHQLRTPLAAVLGQVEVGLRHDRTPEEYRRVLGVVRAQADRMRGLVETLLFLAREGADSALPPPEPTDLAAWLPAHLRTWDGHPRAADLTLAGCGAGPVWAATNPVAFGGLLDNLLDNALKYSPPGTPVRVTLDAPPAGPVVIDVADAGVGIDPADHGDLFRPFFRSAAARRLGVPGSGLGLAVAARLAGAGGAAVGLAESTPGRGSRFRVTLAAVRPAPPAGPPPRPPGAE
ncbi:HAMP domain-containing histidine kinase, partial [bacterium]|nr:HAMP domain-containing histidine kinase [bacterium]